MMLRSTLIPVAWLGFSLMTQAGGQFLIPVPVPPATKLESFETYVGVVIFKASTDLGSISGRTGAVGVKCREVTDTSTGRKEQGIAIVITQKAQPNQILLIDYDEIDSLLTALNYLSKLSASATPLNTFGELAALCEAKKKEDEEPAPIPPAE